jgi:hypothetical protein
VSGEWTARYMRFHAPGQQGFASLDEAVGFLAWQSEDGELAGLDVLAPDGSVALAGEALDQAMARRLDI